MAERQAQRGLGFRPDDTIEIRIMTNAGACFGVVRALKLGQQAVERAQAQKTPLYSLGPLIHTPAIVADLEKKGLRPIETPEEVDKGTVILRSHGVRREKEAELRERGVQIVDATCPLVKKPQRIAQSLGEKAYFLIVVGNPQHPEVQGELSYFGRPDFLVTYDPEEVDLIPAHVQRVGIIAQTTIEVKIFDAIVERARARFPEVLAYNTICDATSIRQTEAVQLSQGADVIVVVGGRNSANTQKLVKICQGIQKETYHIEDLSEVQAHWFAQKRKIGVTAGAATPEDYVNRVGEHIAALIEADHRPEG